MMKPEAGMKKMKAFKHYTPSKIAEPYKVVSTFIDQQEKLLTLLKQARQADLTIRVPISIAQYIRLKLGDVFQFVIEHDERHIVQAKRNLSMK
jgi:hypothetical protein